MSKKIKIFGIGAAVLLVTIALSPVVNSNKEKDEIKLAILGLIEKNEEELATLNKYFEEVALAYDKGEALPEPPERFGEIQKSLVLQWQPIIKQYYQTRQSQPPVYEGTTAIYESDGVAQFFLDEGDYDLYFGHCFAFNRTHTGLICETIEVSVGIALIWSLFLALIPIIGFIYGIILIVWIIPWLLYIKGILDEMKSWPYGSAWFYFDNANHISRLFDKFEIKEQPSYPRPYDPAVHFSQINWTIIKMISYQ